jgi:hypothetical protein
MCLYIHVRNTEEILKELRKNNGKGVMLKRLRYRQKADGQYELVSPFIEKVFSPGDNVSDRDYGKDLSIDEKARREVEHGIHVFTSIARAKHYMKPDEIIVPVTVREKDFVAAGDDEDAVFVKVHLDKEAYNKTIDAIKQIEVSNNVS